MYSTLRIGTGRAFHKAGPDIEKALDPVLVFIRGTTNLFEFVERRYFEHFGRTSKSARLCRFVVFQGSFFLRPSTTICYRF